MLEYQNIKIFLPKVTLLIGLKKFLRLKKLKMQSRRHMLLMILLEKKLLEYLAKTNCKKANQEELTIKKAINIKGDKLYAKWKWHNNWLNS